MIGFDQTSSLSNYFEDWGFVPCFREMVFFNGDSSDSKIKASNIGSL